jgi:beta-N-acetylhexosaminidase
VLEAFVNGIDSLVIGDISPQHSAIEMGGLDTFTAKQKRATKQQQLEQIRILLTTATKASKQRIFVAMRAPYVIAEFSPLLDHAIAAYDYRVFSKADEPLKPSGVVFDVIAQWLNGEFIAKGKLPVSVFLPKQN